MKTIFCDGIFDLFHHGHLKHLQQIHRYFDDTIYLIVGVINDNVSTKYKRTPILSEKHRLKILESCIYVNKVILLDSLIISDSMMKQYQIDYVVHAFADPSDMTKQHDFYSIPIKQDKFIALEYNQGISTTSIIQQSNLSWKDIWENKGKVESENLMLLNGWELTDFNPSRFVKKVVSLLKIKNNHHILEMGCGAGALAKELKQYIQSNNYFGVDASRSLIHKHLQIFGHTVINFNATDTIFKDNYFDFSICNSMLEYLKDMEQLNQVIHELERVSIKGVYFGSVRFVARSEKTSKHIYDGDYQHFVVPKQYFIDNGYTIILSDYGTSERYDAFKIFV